MDGRDKPGHDVEQIKRPSLQSQHASEQPQGKAFAHHLARRYIMTMTLADLEKAVEKLEPDDLARFRAWFEGFDAARFDDKIEKDAESGKLDRLADEALADFRSGRTRAL